jgi:transposase
MLAMVNKTDKLDVRGLNRLQRTGTLPTVWIPPRELRDQRELPRSRMVFSRMRTRLKNRIHATLAKYALSVEEVSDLFGRKGRELLQRVLEKLPPQTRFATERLLEQLEAVERHIKLFEDRIREVFEPATELALVMSLPGVGFILGIVILLEIGKVDRFASAEHLASYAGTTPRVNASDGKVRYDQVRQDVNRYLKWAFMEAANVICLNHRRFPQRHVHRLYERVARRKGYQKAIGAVARHLAEATYWILKKGEPYREPRTQKKVSSTKG